MRDYYFPRDMRAPVLSVEFNQLAAYAALRLVTLKVRLINWPNLTIIVIQLICLIIFTPTNKQSSTGVVDIFVSVIVGFLTSLRVYSVICAVSFYRRARKGQFAFRQALMSKATN